MENCTIEWTAPAGISLEIDKNDTSKKLRFTDAGRHADVISVTGLNEIIDGGYMLEADSGVLGVLYGNSHAEELPPGLSYVEDSRPLGQSDRNRSQMSSQVKADGAPSPSPLYLPGTDSTSQQDRLERLRQAIQSNNYDNELKFSIAVDRLIDKVVE